MWWVIDENGQLIDEFESERRTRRFCDRWNRIGRLAEWNEPMAHVVKGE